MSERRIIAEEAFRAGYNCSQSVALAFADLVNINKEDLLKLCAPFGGGMGRLREVCGAFSGSLVILGLIDGYSTPETGEKKAALYKEVQALASSFEEQHKSIVCREIMGLCAGHSAPTPTPRSADFYEKRPCLRCIGDAAENLETFLLNIGIIK